MHIPMSRSEPAFSWPSSCKERGKEGAEGEGGREGGREGGGRGRRQREKVFFSFGIATRSLLLYSIIYT